MTAVRSYLTNFPHGMTTDIGIRNIPTVVTNSGRNIWVDSNGPGTGSASAKPGGTFQRPFLTVANAIASGNIQSWDTIWVKAGHTETIKTAGGWTIPTANAAGTAITGVRIIGIGNGDERPQITFSTATTASVAVGVAGCMIANIIGICGIASLANPFNIQAAGTTLVIEWRDASSTVSALRAVLTSAAAVNCNFDVKYIGVSGTAVTLNAIRLVGSAGNRINIDFFGTANTGVVEFLTTAATNTLITGMMNNSLGSTTHTKEVVDTVTGSHWAAAYWDCNSSSTDTALYFHQA